MKYTPFYCEENVWWLAQEPQLAGIRREVVFISNAHRACPVFHQRAAGELGEPVVWDYHVVLAAGDDAWDLDCVLGAPLPRLDWLEASFGPCRAFPARYQPRFRVIDGDEFVRTFASDRSHMRRRDGSFQRPPPAWPCIGTGTNLAQFSNVAAPFAGEVLGLDALAARWR